MRGRRPAARSITRPLLHPWSVDAVRIEAQPHELPVTYVSMGRRQVFIDFDFRERVYWELYAHISVSTGLWRIPLAGDDPTQPIQPGDELREFEEFSIRDWDASAEPVLGDIRIMRGDLSRVRVDFECAPLSGGGAWFRAGPWEVLQCPAPSGNLCREDFIDIGTGMRYADRDCTEPGQPVRFLTWAARQDLIGEGA